MVNLLTHDDFREVHFGWKTMKFRSLVPGFKVANHDLEEYLNLLDEKVQKVFKKSIRILPVHFNEEGYQNNKVKLVKEIHKRELSGDEEKIYFVSYINKNHWTFSEINFITKEITYYDSKPDSTQIDEKQKLVKKIMTERIGNIWPKKLWVDFRIQFAQGFANQTDSISCGIFVICQLTELIFLKRIIVTENELGYQRYKIASSLIKKSIRVESYLVPQLQDFRDWKLTFTNQDNEKIKKIISPASCLLPRNENVVLLGQESKILEYDLESEKLNSITTNEKIEIHNLQFDQEAELLTVTNKNEIKFFDQAKFMGEGDMIKIIAESNGVVFDVQFDNIFFLKEKDRTTLVQVYMGNKEKPQYFEHNFDKSYIKLIAIPEAGKLLVFLESHHLLAVSYGINGEIKKQKFSDRININVQITGLTASKDLICLVGNRIGNDKEQAIFILDSNFNMKTNRKIQSMNLKDQEEPTIFEKVKFGPLLPNNQFAIVSTKGGKEGQIGLTIFAVISSRYYEEVDVYYIQRFDNVHSKGIVDFQIFSKSLFSLGADGNIKRFRIKD